MIVFNEDGCIKCGACQGTCPTSAIEVTPNAILHCDTCGEEPKCADVCPQGALKVEMYEIAEGVEQARLVFNSILCDQCGKCEEVCPQEFQLHLLGKCQHIFDTLHRILQLLLIFHQ